MLSFFNTQEKQVFFGNILFIICCVFYLAWWLLAFNPSGTPNGMKTGWLLIPASIAGLLGVIIIFMGIFAQKPAGQILGNGYILWGGIILYLVLMTVTVYLLKRPATTELILIVGWAMLMLAEINALFGYGSFSRGLSVGLMAVVCAAAVISLVCYVFYYRLDAVAGYIDGMVPLLLSAMVMAVISGLMLSRALQK
ncbi:MAG: hypothetical protein FWF22_04635 [Treponema sp.]|nr:hypothetical protein [Treponema sp.]